MAVPVIASVGADYTADAVDLLTDVTVDGGTMWYWFLVGKGMA